MVYISKSIKALKKKSHLVHFFSDMYFSLKMNEDLQELFCDLSFYVTHGREICIGRRKILFESVGFAQEITVLISCFREQAIYHAKLKSLGYVKPYVKTLAPRIICINSNFQVIYRAKFRCLYINGAKVASIRSVDIATVAWPA